MNTTRRIFLEIIGSGAAASALATGCGGALVPPSETDGGVTGTGIGGASGSAGGTTDVGSGATAGAAGSASGTGGAPTPAGNNGGPTPAGTGGSASGQPAGGTPTLGPRDVLAGNLSQFAVGALVVVGQNVAIGRDANGLYALTIVCTHQGCPVGPSSAGGTLHLACPCHGSQFDLNGAVLRGPANRPLAHFAVEVDAAGNVIVHTAVQVSPATRTAA